MNKKLDGKKVKLNHITGKPKKWVCYDNKEIDKHLDGLEVLYSCWRNGRGHDEPLQGKIASEVVAGVNAMLDLIKLYMDLAKTKKAAPSSPVKFKKVDIWKDFSRN